MRELKKLFADERGVILVITLLILTLLIGAGAGAIVSVQTDFKTSGNLRAATQALYNADAGIDHARQELHDPDSPNFGSIFNSPNETVIVSESFNGGTYRVTRQDSATNPSRIKVLSVGTAPNNARAEIEAWLGKDAGKPSKAVETNGDLMITGSPSIVGRCGGVHKDAYEASHSSGPSYYVPRINPADYAPYVAALGSGGSGYILHNDGTVTTGGTCTAGLCEGGTGRNSPPTGWTWDGSNWVVNGGSAASGVYYVETAVTISGNPGSAETPWQATIIAWDSIIVSGNPFLTPYPTATDELKNTQFVTGNDLVLGGDPPSGGYQGALLIHQQFRISGNPTINGFIIAGDGQPTWLGDPFPNANASSPVPINEINGNPSVTYACDFGCSGPGCPPGTITQLVWTNKF